MLWWMNHVCQGNIVDQGQVVHQFQDQSDLEAGQNNRQRDLLSKWSQEPRQYPQQLVHINHWMPEEQIWTNRGSGVRFLETFRELWHVTSCILCNYNIIDNWRNRMKQVSHYIKNLWCEHYDIRWAKIEWQHVSVSCIQLFISIFLWSKQFHSWSIPNLCMLKWSSWMRQSRPVSSYLPPTTITTQHTCTAWDIKNMYCSSMDSYIDRHVIIIIVQLWLYNTNSVLIFTIIGPIIMVMNAIIQILIL